MTASIGAATWSNTRTKQAWKWKVRQAAQVISTQHMPWRQVCSEKVLQLHPRIPNISHVQGSMSMNLCCREQLIQSRYSPGRLAGMAGNFRHPRVQRMMAYLVTYPFGQGCTGLEVTCCVLHLMSILTAKGNIDLMQLKPSAGLPSNHKVLS